MGLNHLERSFASDFTWLVSLSFTYHRSSPNLSSLYFQDSAQHQFSGEYEMKVLCLFLLWFDSYNIRLFFIPLIVSGSVPCMLLWTRFNLCFIEENYTSAISFPPAVTKDTIFLWASLLATNWLPWFWVMEMGYLLPSY